MKSVFVTVGTTRFDKLCQMVLTSESVELLKRLGFDKMVVQLGNSECGELAAGGDFNDFEIETYKFKDSIVEDMRRADLIVSHAGAGTCLEALDMKKPLLVVVNDDLMDNHQTEIAERLQRDGHLRFCACENFLDALKEMDISALDLRPLPAADPSPLFRHLDRIFGII